MKNKKSFTMQSRKNLIKMAKELCYRMSRDDKDKILSVSTTENECYRIMKKYRLSAS